MMKKLFNILIGITLILIGILSGIFSTYATIIPISLSFDGSTKVTIVGIFVIVQVSVFFLAMIKNYIAMEIPQHYILVRRITNILMLVSIVSTVTFFNMQKHGVIAHQKSIDDIYNIIPFLKVTPFYDWLVNITINIIFIWSVCIILDVLAIKSPLIGFDIMFNIKSKTKIENTTIASMIYTILTYKPKQIIESKYLEIKKKDIYKNEDIFIEGLNKKNDKLDPKIMPKLLEESSLNNQNNNQIILDKKSDENILKNNEKNSDYLSLKKPLKKSFKLIGKKSELKKRKRKQASNVDACKNEKNNRNNNRLNNQNKNRIILEQKIGINNRKNDDKKIDKKIEKITDYLRTNFNENEFVKSFQKMFNLSIVEYKIIRQKLKENNVIYVKGNKSYLAKQDSKIIKLRGKK